MLKLKYILVIHFFLFFLIGNTQVVDSLDASVQDSVEVLQEELEIPQVDSITETTNDPTSNDDVELESTDEFEDSFPEVDDAESTEDFNSYPIDEQEPDYASPSDENFILVDI